MAVCFCILLLIPQPERLTGDKYALESDIWSLGSSEIPFVSLLTLLILLIEWFSFLTAGLSLIELATGHFPIPPEVPVPPPVPIRNPPCQIDSESRRNPLAIFELLSFVVDGVPPR